MNNALAHGVDLVWTARIAEMLRDHGQKFLDRCFTPAEQAYCASNTKRHVEHLAARFAAKEAVLKALGTGLADGISWTDVEIVRDASGRPEVVLHGRAAEVAVRQCIRTWLVSLSHIEKVAMASVIGLS